MKRTISFLLMMVFIGVFFVACSGKQEDTSSSSAAAPVVEYRDTLNIVLEAEPSTLFPHDQNQSWTENILRQIYDSLLYRTMDDKWEFTSEVAKSWEYIADDVVRFHLNDNIYFSNGYKLTAEDIKFTLENANKFPRIQFFQMLEKVEVIDPLTVDVYTIGPYPAFFSNLAMPRPGIISKQYFEEVGIDGYARNPIGTGPYELESWTPGSDIVLKARDDYWRGKPATERLRFTFVPEASNRSVEMETGTVDLDIAPDFNDLDRLAELGFTVIPKTGYYITSLFIHYGNVPNIKVRQALAYAIDYPAVVETVYGKWATVADGIFPPLVAGYQKNWNIKYDLEKAKQLVAEANLPDGFELELLTQNLTETSQLSEILQYYWRQAGLNVKLSYVQNANVVRRQNAGEYQIIAHPQRWATGDPSRATSMWDGKIPEMFSLPPAINEQFKDYWDRCAAELDVAKRMEMYKEYQDKVLEQFIFIPISYKAGVYVLSPKVENFFPAPGSIVDLRDVKVRK